jgi:hypothetical protein
METVPVKYALPSITNGLTKSKIESLALVAVDSVLEQGNPLHVAEALSGMEAFIKMVKENDRFRDYVREELQKSQGTHTTDSAKIEACEAGVKYLFDKCNNPILEGLYASQAALDLQVKERETFLKSVPKAGLEITHEDELVTVYPPYKKSTSTYKVTLSK